MDLFELLRPSANQRIIYELKPKIRAHFKGKRITTDSFGFRITPHEARRPTSTVRVLGIGDSVMFGWGVADSDTYMAKLSMLLSTAFPEVGWRMINTAVPGYNTAMEVETLVEKGLVHDPHAVVLGWVNNDLDLPDFLRPHPSVLGLDRLFLADWIQGKLRRSNIDPFGGPQITTASTDPETTRTHYLDRLTEHEREIVGPEAFDRAMARLAKVATEQDMVVVVLVHRGRAPLLLRRACDEHGFALVNAHRTKKRFMRSHQIKTEDGSVLTVADDDPHPSSVGHRLLARALAEYLTTRSVLGRKLVEAALDRGSHLMRRRERSEPRAG